MALLAAAFALSVLTAGAPAKEPVRAAGTAAEKAAITRVITRYFAALNASDTGAILRLYSADGVFLQPSQATWVGKEAIGRAYDTLFRGAKVDTDLRLAEIVPMSSGWAFARATAGGAITSKANGVKQDGPTQELFIMRKDGDGQWKIARFAFSTVASRAASGRP